MATKRITRPLGRNIVIEVVIPESNIILTEGAIANIDTKDFVVVAVGPECTRGIKVGDIVQPSDGMHGVPTVDGRDMNFVVNETDIVAVLELLLGEEA